MIPLKQFVADVFGHLRRDKKVLVKQDLHWVTNTFGRPFPTTLTLIRGRPKATVKHSVEELESWGMYGLYRLKGDTL